MMDAKSISDATRPAVHEVGHVLGRRHSSAVLAFHQAIAESLGINATDLKALELVAWSEEGTVTASQIAQATGITSGAATFLVDRLEKAGIFTRHRDPADRRRVVLRVTPEQQERIAGLYAPLGAGMEQLAAQYSDEELALIGGFVQRSDEVLAQATQQLRTGDS